MHSRVFPTVSGAHATVSTDDLWRRASPSRRNRLALRLDPSQWVSVLDQACRQNLVAMRCLYGGRDGESPSRPL